jgi:hypothetical protein
MIFCYFALLFLDFKAALGSAIPINQTAEYTTININARVALDPNSWDLILDRVWRVSRPLFD